jgi:hypothetical protein
MLGLDLNQLPRTLCRALRRSDRYERHAPSRGDSLVAESYKKSIGSGSVRWEES